MKANLVLIIIILAVLTACATAKQDTVGQTVTLDQAIREAARTIENNVQAGQKIAVLNFTSPTEQFSEYVIDELSIQLANGKKFVVVDRRELELIRQEERFQLSGEVSDESAQSIGKKLGAQLVISGSLTSMGNAYRFRIRVLNVESAAVETGSTADLSTGETKIAFMLSGAKPAPVAVQQPAAPPQNPVPSNMIRINGGTFTMGSFADEPERRDNEVQHQVTVSSFYMGKYEVTQKEYREIMGTNPSNFRGDNLPVESVSWFDAIEYCNKRSQKEGLTPVYTISGSGDNRTVTWNRSANGYRLPTEAEWEYVCRAGTATPFSTGNNITTNQANYDGNNPYNNNTKGDNRQKTTPVGSFAPNAWGLYDMHGNVWEWCWDWYGIYPNGAQTDPQGAASGSNRTLRGGSWYNGGWYLRSAYRGSNIPSGLYTAYGFRLVHP